MTLILHPPPDEVPPPYVAVNPQSVLPLLAFPPAVFPSDTGDAELCDECWQPLPAPDAPCPTCDNRALAVPLATVRRLLTAAHQPPLLLVGRPAGHRGPCHVWTDTPDLIAARRLLTACHAVLVEAGLVVVAASSDEDGTPYLRVTRAAPESETPHAS